MKHKSLEFYKSKKNIIGTLSPKERYDLQKWRQWLNYRGIDIETLDDAALNQAFEDYYQRKPKKFTAITATVSEEQREKWQQFIKQNNIKSEGALIKTAIDFYIEHHS